MYKTVSEIDRVTISLPHAIACEIETLRAQLNISRSEIFRLAVERFIEEQQRSRLQTIAAEMSEEYRSNRELVVCTAIDAEDFA
ncbi:MAG: ribbon-helix-helix protein, CopG family [Deltaproteobacteria bacterium]|jgi:metal-responsive CopG/Arc/MetJ family transcriptional regulator|nr:ribbon-helix-helix protein, CopG family [Deltaproteobacteria bacterium]